MTDQTMKQTGDFCWAELATSDIKNAKDFYQTIMNWQYDDMPMPQGGDYTMMKVGENAVAGGFQLTAEMEAEGAQPNWCSYILVDDADATTERAKELGATVYKEPFDVMEMGRMAVIGDPTGAIFCLWQAKQGPAFVASKNENGNVGWNELITNNPEKAEQFYKTLFGWQSATQEMSPGKHYTTFSHNGAEIAGMRRSIEEMAVETPQWVVYFSVNNIEEAIAKAKANAGKVLHDPIDYPGGRFTTIRDPQGVNFSVIEFASQ